MNEIERLNAELDEPHALLVVLYTMLRKRMAPDLSEAEFGDAVSAEPSYRRQHHQAPIDPGGPVH